MKRNMKKKQLENAINRCWVEHHIGNKVLNDDEVKNFNPLPSENFKEGFIAGCEWRINSAWHKPCDIAEPGKSCLVENMDGDGDVCIRIDWRSEYEWVHACHYDKVLRWAYVEDLL